ncbi:hypothetical protein L211DRAFT_264261 [Terfezia boudieri ATCC MYA-4762]|uniref:Uncharacterized protein n=1 Tax=Terfezia boudieri ATCC MYA-4762 TaxID=1051890 RepID=A0A3N4M2H9_9PEZI|nr:hypothetical protein L211DRAFT_264261 [Terfezia boudieri ATCC MYA-4762]
MSSEAGPAPRSALESESGAAYPDLSANVQFRARRSQQTRTPSSPPPPEPSRPSAPQQPAPPPSKVIAMSERKTSTLNVKLSGAANYPRWVTNIKLQNGEGRNA